MTEPNESRWVFILPQPAQSETVTHWPAASTLCERTVADSLVALWQEQATKLAAVLASTEFLPTVKGQLNLGGIAKIDRKVFQCELDGLTLNVPARDVGDYLHILAERMQKLETVGGQPYCTVPSWPSNIFLSIAHCASLVKQLQSVLAEAEAIATIENDEFNREITTSPFFSAPKRPVGPMGKA